MKKKTIIIVSVIVVAGVTAYLMRDKIKVLFDKDVADVPTK